MKKPLESKKVVQADPKASRYPGESLSSYRGRLKSMGKFVGKNLSNKRSPGESFEAYRARLKENNKAVKEYLQNGAAFWVSCVDELIRNTAGQITAVQRHVVQGTYRRGMK